MKITGTIFNIQHFSVHDGPGIRTAVFMKGCPLKCRWCANPESQSFKPEPAWSRSKCIDCGGCVKAFDCAFDERGLHFGDNFTYNANEVNKVCPGGALHMIGEEKTAEEVVDLCERDRAFFGDDGGITVTGGEPLSQIDFTVAILDEAHRRGINTAIETCGLAPESDALAAAERSDTYLTDIKCINEELHKEHTGASNERILGNISAIAEHYPEKPIRVRTPVIPGFNDNEKELALIAEFLNRLKGTALKWELLRYHRLGLPKYQSLDRKYPMGDADMTQEQFDILHRYAKTLFANTI